MKAIDQPLQPNRASPQATGMVAWYPALGQVGAGHWRNAAGTNHLALDGSVAVVPDPARQLAARLGAAPGHASGDARVDLAALLPGNALSVCAWVGVGSADGEADECTIASVLALPCFSLSSHLANGSPSHLVGSLYPVHPLVGGADDPARSHLFHLPPRRRGE